MNWQLWALCLLLAGSLSLTYAEKAEQEEKLPAIVVVEEKSAESAAQDDSESTETMPLALEPVPIVPAEEISGSPVKPAFRVSKVNADKVVAFITRAGQIFEIEDENGIGMIEGRQAGQIANATDNYVCNMGSVLIYSDEPCDEIAVLDSDTIKKEQETQAAASEVEQTQREQSNQQRRRKNAAAKKRKQQQLMQQKRRKANQQKRRPNGQRRRPQQQLTQQQKRNRNKRLQAKRRKQQQQLQQLEEELEENVQTIKVKRPRPQSLQKRRQQQQRKRRRQQQQKRRRQQQKQKKKKQQQQNGVVMAGMAAVAGGGSGPQIQVLPQQSPGNGQRIRLLVRRGQGVRLDQNADYPRWQWADEYDN